MYYHTPKEIDGFSAGCVCDHQVKFTILVASHLCVRCCAYCFAAACDLLLGTTIVLALLSMAGARSSASSQHPYLGQSPASGSLHLEV